MLAARLNAQQFNFFFLEAQQGLSRQHIFPGQACRRRFTFSVVEDFRSELTTLFSREITDHNELKVEPETNSEIYLTVISS